MCEIDRVAVIGTMKIMFDKGNIVKISHITSSHNSWRKSLVRMSHVNLPTRVLKTIIRPKNHHQNQIVSFCDRSNGEKDGDMDIVRQYGETPPRPEMQELEPSDLVADVQMTGTVDETLSIPGEAYAGSLTNAVCNHRNYVQDRNDREYIRELSDLAHGDTLNDRVRANGHTNVPPESVGDTLGPSKSKKDNTMEGCQADEESDDWQFADMPYHTVKTRQEEEIVQNNFAELKIAPDRSDEAIFRPTR